MEHVLCIPMAFSDSNTGSLSRHMVYICTCQEMHSTATQVLNLGIETRHSYEGKPPGLLLLLAKFFVRTGALQPKNSDCTADFQSYIKPCIHAKAVSFFSTEERWLHAVADGDLYTHANEVMLDEHPVVIIRSGCMTVSSLLLSVCSKKAGWPRSLVGSTKDSVFCCYDPSCCSKRRRFKCDHCTTASEWLTSVHDQLGDEGLVSEDLKVLADMAADLEGMHLHSQHAAGGAMQHGP